MVVVVAFCNVVVVIVCGGCIYVVVYVVAEQGGFAAVTQVRINLEERIPCDSLPCCTPDSCCPMYLCKDTTSVPCTTWSLRKRRRQYFSAAFAGTPLYAVPLVVMCSSSVLRLAH